MNKVIVFAGTTEGREICSFLKKYEIASLACTATEYGKCRIEEGGALTVRSGRMTEEEMEQLFGEEQPEMVIDATHPYADLVSENIRSACEKQENVSSAAAAVACGRSILRHGRYDRRSGIVSGGHRGKDSGDNRKQGTRKICRASGL